MAVTIRDIAKQLRVSQSTVSRALNKPDDPWISEATRQRVLEAAREMGYRPNLSAQALVTGRTHIIELWAETLHDIKVRAVNSLLDEAKPGDYNIAITQITKLPDWEQRLRAGPVLPIDGILALECSVFTQEYLDCHPNNRMPIVSIGIYHVESTDFVEMDIRSGVAAAVHHLAEGGCRSIAYFTCEWGNRESDPRYRGYHDAMRELALEPEVIVAKDAEFPDARDAMYAYVRYHPLPGGLVCFNDVMAIGAHKAFRDQGIRMPEDVALVGCDGLEETEFMSPALSTVAQPVEEMCRLGWEFLFKRLEEPDAPLQRARVTPNLIVRETSNRAYVPKGGVRIGS